MVEREAERSEEGVHWAAAQEQLPGSPFGAVAETASGCWWTSSQHSSLVRISAVAYVADR